MAEYILSHAATNDVAEVFDYSLHQFGLDKATEYYLGLESIFKQLATHPQLGKNAGHLQPNLRQYAHGSHVIYYQPRDDGVYVLRILHHRRDTERM